MSKGGGGGGSSGTPYYAQQDRLFGTQADISQQLYNQYAELAPGYLANTQSMVGDAMDGTLSKQMTEQAGNAAQANVGAALDANARNMQRFGARSSANRLLAENSRNAIMGAAIKTNAMNGAAAAAEEAKWNRNAGAYGQIAGMGTGSMSGMGSAAAGFGAAGNAAQSGSMANAQGFGKFGSAIAGIGMGYAKGGEVKRNCFAGGAYVRKPFVNHLSQIDWRNRPTTAQNNGSGVGSTVAAMAAGAAPIMAVMAAKDLMSKDSRIISMGKDGANAIKDFAGSKTAAPAPTTTSGETPPFAEDAPATGSTSTMDVPTEQKFALNTGLPDTTPNQSLGSTINSVTKPASPTSPDGDAYMAKAAQVEAERQAQEAAAKQAAEEEAQRQAAEQASQTATSSMDGGYACGGFIKRGIKLASGGFAQQIGGGSFESDPDRFKAKPPTMAEQMAERAGNGVMGAALNPMTYKNGYDRYQREVAKIEGKKSLVDSKPETPGVSETAPVEAPAAVEEVPLQESPAMTDQQQFSQAFNGATAPEQASPTEPEAINSDPTTVDSGSAPVADGAAPSSNGAVAADGSAPAADGATPVSDSTAPAAEGSGSVADGAATTGDATGAAGEGAADAAATTGAADGAAAGADGAASGVDAGGALAVGKAAVDIANGRDAGTAVADAAAGYAGAEAGATIGSAVGPVGTVVGGVLGGVLGGAIFADGGEADSDAVDQSGMTLQKADDGDIERADFTPGGDVRGPGTETSDDIPAWLSDGEIVHNADAVKLAGKDALIAINDAGLEAREGKASPEEAQAKIGQVMIERGKQLVGGHGFVKRGVKLAGGGFLGGNLGVALGAGVDQYNIQAARTDQKERFDKAYELQKENNDRLNKIAEQQAVEFENRQKDRKDTEALKANIVGIANKHQTIGKDADQYIANEAKTNAAAAKDAGVEYQPMTPEQQAVIKQSVSKTPEQEVIDVYRGAGKLDAAAAMEGKRDQKQLGENVASQATNPLLKELAKAYPVEAAKLQIGEISLKEKLEASERNNAARLQNALAVVEARNAARSGSKSSKSGSGGDDDGGLSDKDRLAAFNLAIPDEGLTIVGADGKQAGTLNKGAVYAQSNARLSDLKRFNPGVDDHTLINTSIEATKFHNGIAPNGVVNFKEDGKGGFLPVMTVREATGSREFVIGSAIPFNQIGSLDAEKLKRLNTQLPSKDQVARAELSYAKTSLGEAQEFKAKFDSLSRDQVANLPPELRKKGMNIDQEIARLDALLSAYAEPAGREARGIKAPAGFVAQPKQSKVANDRELFNAISRVNTAYKNRPEERAGMVDYLKEWFNPTLGKN